MLVQKVMVKTSLRAKVFVVGKTYFYMCTSRHIATIKKVRLFFRKTFVTVGQGTIWAGWT